jgi:hypothetical protein
MHLGHLDWDVISNVRTLDITFRHASLFNSFLVPEHYRLFENLKSLRLDVCEGRYSAADELLLNNFLSNFQVVESLGLHKLAILGSGDVYRWIPNTNISNPSNARLQLSLSQSCPSDFPQSPGLANQHLLT